MTQLINREDAVVIDVREASEYNAGHLLDARHIPVGELAKRAGEAISAYVRRLQDQGWLYRSGHLTGLPSASGGGLRSFRVRETHH